MQHLYPQCYTQLRYYNSYKQVKSVGHTIIMYINNSIIIYRE